MRNWRTDTPDSWNEWDRYGGHLTEIVVFLFLDPGGWLIIRQKIELVNEARRSRKDTIERSFGEDAGSSNGIENHRDGLRKAMVCVSQQNGTTTKNTYSDWEMLLCFVVESGWKKHLEEMAKISVVSKDPGASHC